jgi:hypothetical protein
MEWGKIRVCIHLLLTHTQVCSLRQLNIFNCELKFRSCYHIPVILLLLVSRVDGGPGGTGNQSNNFREEQHQNAQWSGLPIDMCCVTAFFFGGPSKVVHCTHSGVRGQCPLRGLWLLTCYILNNILVLRGGCRKVWAIHRLWKGRFSWRWAWLHFFILHIRCVVLRLIAVGIY